jgi:hypothetical protein
MLTTSAGHHPSPSRKQVYTRLVNSPSSASLRHSASQSPYVPFISPDHTPSCPSRAILCMPTISATLSIGKQVYTRLINSPSRASLRHSTSCPPSRRITPYDTTHVLPAPFVLNPSLAAPSRLGCKASNFAIVRWIFTEAGDASWVCED